MCALIECTDPTTLVGRRNRTLLLLDFTMVARRSEPAGLDLVDVRTTANSLEVFVATSKTDKDSAGTTAGAVLREAERLEITIRDENGRVHELPDDEGEADAR
ncbi:site-specific recombinase XerD [Spinactinospora alkalitolerans]|uniref:Site-specific recombinase XerD n=1 Tax=Spinactinospora alkalitolerans TaxID=687207 RepID=A0A852U8Q9_9ACTN|nr:hypothetical protein [Spinactinospora alkalitolerans]NYE50484.1 site-specific recombinase XerD [Spinactinospora alkalitolerans]